MQAEIASKSWFFSAPLSRKRAEKVLYCSFPGPCLILSHSLCRMQQLCQHEGCFSACIFASAHLSHCWHAVLTGAEHIRYYEPVILQANLQEHANFWNVSATSRISWDCLWHTGTISLREEIGFPTADGFPGLAYPTPTVLKLLNAQLIFPRMSKRIEPTPEILHCSSCIISQALRKGPTVSLCTANKFSPSQLCATLLFLLGSRAPAKINRNGKLLPPEYMEHLGYLVYK